MPFGAVVRLKLDGVVESDVVPVLDDFHSPVVGLNVKVAEVVGVVTVAVVSPCNAIVVDCVGFVMFCKVLTKFDNPPLSNPKYTQLNG